MNVDYNRISQDYDRFRKVGGPHIPVLARVAGERGAKRVLEVGCGTGNATSAFLDLHPCELVGLDQSSGMIEKARSKIVDVQFVRGEADRLPFADGAFDFLFASFVIHHVRDLGRLFDEWSRVTAKGAVAIATAPHEYIKRHPLNPFFPSFRDIDLARFPSIETIRMHLENAGWRDIHAEKVVGAPFPVDAYYADRVANKFISTLELLPEGEFEAGLAQLQAEVAARGCLMVDSWEALVVWGKP